MEDVVRVDRGCDEDDRLLPGVGAAEEPESRLARSSGISTRHVPAHRFSSLWHDATCLRGRGVRIVQSTVAALVVPASAAAFGPVAEALNSNKGNERQTLNDNEDLRNDPTGLSDRDGYAGSYDYVDTDRRPDGATTDLWCGKERLDPSPPRGR
jgi:hypothetical protein